MRLLLSAAALCASAVLAFADDAALYNASTTQILVTPSPKIEPTSPLTFMKLEPAPPLSTLSLIVKPEPTPTPSAASEPAPAITAPSLEDPFLLQLLGELN